VVCRGVYVAAATSKWATSLWSFQLQNRNKPEACDLERLSLLHTHTRTAISLSIQTQPKHNDTSLFLFFLIYR